MLFIVSLVAFFASTNDQQRLIDELMNALPLNEDAGRSALEGTISGVINNRGALGIVGFLATGYTAGALFTSVRVALNGVFHVDDPRPFVLGKTIDLALVAGFGLLLLASFALTLAIAFAQQQADALVGDEFATLVAWLANLAYLLIPPLVTALVFLLLYTSVAHVGYTWRDVLPGVVVAALLLEALKVGFAWYIASFGNYDATYGALGFVVILLLFFNFSAQVMLVGAEVARANAEVRELDRTGGGRPVVSKTLGSVRAAFDSARSIPVLGRFVPPFPGFLSIDEADLPVEEPPHSFRREALASIAGAEPELLGAESTVAAEQQVAPSSTAEPPPRESALGTSGAGFGRWAALTTTGLAIAVWLSGRER